MAGERTRFSSGAIDIRDTGCGAVGLCSSLVVRPTENKLLTDKCKTTLPTVPLFVTSVKSEARKGIAYNML